MRVIKTPVVKILPDSLTDIIDGHVESGIRGGGAPLYSDASVCQLTRLTRSAETRSGLILQRAIVEGLKRGAEYTVITPRTFPVTNESKRTLEMHEILEQHGGPVEAFFESEEG